MSGAKGSRAFFSDACPKSYRFFLKDEIHSDASFWKFYDIKKSPGDGHCLLPSVLYGVNNQIFLQNTCDLNDIIQLIRIETTSNIDLYVSFLVQETRAMLLAQMNMYIYEKRYDTIYGDMLPLILSNALCLNLIILSQSASGYDIHKVIAGFSNNSDKYILVHKYKDHYDVITIKAEINNANMNDQTSAFCTPPISDSNPPLVACPPTHVPGSLNNISGGDFLSCDTLDTTSTTSSDEHGCDDASLSSINESDTNLDVSHEKSLSDLCVVYDLSNLVDGPTCFKGDTPSSIDVLLSTEPKRFKNSLNSSCSISDFHNLTCVATKLHKLHIEPKTIYYRSYRFWWRHLS